MTSRPPDKDVTIGIDFGTTNTVVAYVKGKIPRCVPTDKGNLVLPSVVALSQKGEVIVGAVAKDQMVVNPTNTIYGVKRLIGRKFKSKAVRESQHYFSYEMVEDDKGDVAVVLNGQVRSIEDLSSLILGHCKRVSETFLERPVSSAVITVPAYFSDAQRAAVKRAGELAGLNVKRIVNEPTAAALAYGFNRGFDQRILIFDLGGGTFDLSVLQLHGNVFEVVATGGDTYLGGVDFDNRIIEYVLEEFRNETKIDLAQSPIAMQRIKSAAEAAKIDLSVMANVVIELPYIEDRRGKPVDLRVALSREKLNILTKDLVERAIEATRKTLAEKNVLPESIAEILLVGGQTRMPLVQGRVHQFFRKPPRKGVHPDEVVALGAALYGESLHEIDSVTLVDVLSVPIGIANQNGRMRRLIDKNETIPISKGFRVPGGTGKGVAIEVFQGDSELAVDNEYLGRVHLPEDAVGKRVVFQLDEECMLHVHLDRGEGKLEEIVLATKDTPKALRDAWKEAMDRREAEAQAQESEQEEGGFFSSIRKIWGG